MYEKLSKWLELLERLVNLIRPKAYNTIAKIVVFTGVGLLVESQVNFFRSLAVALFEQYLGKSEVLREVLTASDNTIPGISLVIIGMLYHLVVTLGNEFIQNQKAKLPQLPELIVSLSTIKKPGQCTDVYLDGPVFKIPKTEEIPDFKETRDSGTKGNEIDSLFSKMMSGPLGGMRAKAEVYTNKNFYRERADFVDKWFGFEPLELHLSNRGKTLADGVSVQVVLPKNEDCMLIKVPNMQLPPMPAKTYTNQIYTRHKEFDTDFLNYRDKMRIIEELDFYKICWDVDMLQAGVIATGNKKIYLRVKKAVEIKCTVFCNALPEPASTTLIINPPEEAVKLSIDELISDEKFNLLFSQWQCRTT